MDFLLIFSMAANGVLPVVLTILVGYVLKRTGFLTEEFTRVGYKLVFNVLMPVMLFLNVYEMESFRQISWGLIGYSMGMVVLIFFLGMAVAVLTSGDPAKRGSLLQVSFRSDVAIIALPLAAALGGQEASAIISYMTGFTVVLFNVLAVLSFRVFPSGKGKKGSSFPEIAKSIGRNPLIQGILFGLAALLIRELQKSVFGQQVFSLKEDIPFLYDTMKNLKAISTPFALVVLGGQFVFSAVKDCRREVIVGTLMRIVAAPLLGVGTAVILQKCFGVPWVNSHSYPVLLGIFGSPVAVISGIMASQMGGDEPLATQLTLWTSLGSIFTVFASVCILVAAGLM